MWMGPVEPSMTNTKKPALGILQPGFCLTVGFR